MAAITEARARQAAQQEKEKTTKEKRVQAPVARTNTLETQCFVDAAWNVLGSKTVATKLTSKSPKRKRRNLLRQILFQNRFFFTKIFAEETRVIEQELEKVRYAATERVLRSAAT